MCRRPGPDRVCGRRLRRAGVLALPLVAACAGSPPVATGPEAGGAIAGQRLHARVDAEIARYYVETFPAEHPRDWHKALAEATVLGADGAVSGEALRAVARRHDSVDLAALLFMEQIHALPRNRRFADCVADLEASLRQPDRNPRELGERIARHYRVLLAPGWLYESNPQTEADFSRTRRGLERFGIPYRFLPLAEDGTVAENARRLARTIRDRSADARPLILVTASKSAAEAALALGHLLEPDEAAAVAAWINAGGVVHGTPLADHWTSFPRSLLARLAFLRYGWRYASLTDLRTDRSAERMARVELPEELLVVNYVAVPMAAQVTPGARDRYRLLSRNGPNDGLAPLANTLVAGGVTMVEPGADHYFHAVDLGRRTPALAGAVFRYLQDGRCGAGAPAPGES